VLEVRNMKKSIAIAGIAAIAWSGAAISSTAQTAQGQPQTQTQGQGQSQTTPAARGRHPRHRSPEERFKRLDKNNDGKISRDEWPRQGKAFDRIDANHDGVLTQDELRQAAKNRKGRR
jgi:EF hand